MSLEDIREARRELDEVIAEIQTVAGYERFLAPPEFDDIAQAAADCPLVYLAAADPGGLALIVRHGEVEYVPLKQLTASAVRDRLEAHLRVYAAYRADPEAYDAVWSASLDAVTAWLWEVAMGDVLAVLRASDEAVLVAGGLLGLVPLHAAWTPDAASPTGRRYALDDIGLRYAPNARSLEAARDIAAGTSASRLLAVVDPRPAPAPPLPFAAVEGAVARNAFAPAATVLDGGTATPMALKCAVLEADVLHLACHGFADLADPLQSGLLLAGNQQITLRDLMGLQLRVRLAVLSACETSLPGTALPDEVVALPTGLLQAGVGGVVASMWAVPDLATAMLMTEFYRRWRWDDRPPATALCEAQQWLRDTTNDEKRRGWERQATEGAAWLPPEAADAFLDEVAVREPEEREHAAIHAWGAFAHVGD